MVHDRRRRCERFEDTLLFLSVPSSVLGVVVASGSSGFNCRINSLIERRSRRRSRPIKFDYHPTDQSYQHNSDIRSSEMTTPSAEEASGSVSPVDDIDIEKGSASTAADGPDDAPADASAKKKKKSTASKKEQEFETETPSLLRFILLARPELLALLTSLFLVLAADGVNLVVPIVIARAYDALVDPTFDDDERGTVINRTMTLVLVFTAVGSILGWIRGFLQGLIGERVVARMRLQLCKYPRLCVSHLHTALTPLLHRNA